jgi:hypothetical protein
MTAYATIETRRLEQVTVIPNQAIRIDRQGSQSTIYAEKLDEEGELMRVEIELGLRNGQVTQVVAGLDEGDPARAGPNPEPIAEVSIL